jgi:hypothetical protein
MRVRRTTLADGRYLIFYEFVTSEESAPQAKESDSEGPSSPQSPETREAGV